MRWRLLQIDSLRSTPILSWPWTLRTLLTLCLILDVELTFAAVPVNGRIQDFAYSRDAVQVAAAAAYHQSLHELKLRAALDRNPQLLKRLKGIALPIIAQAVLLKPEAAHWSWEIHVANATQINAYCMAGGKILVGSEFLEKQDLSDSEIAALLAHEIGHAIAEHVREELSFVKRMSPDYAHYSLEEVISLLGWDLSLSLKLAPLSRLQELEADDIGITLATRAGFDPRALIGFYRKTSSDQSGGTLLDTHGPGMDRLRAVQNFAVYAETPPDVRRIPAASPQIVLK